MEETVSVDEAAKKLGVHRNTIYNRIKRGNLIAFKHREGWRISEACLKSRSAIGEQDRLASIAQAAQALEIAIDGYTTPIVLMNVRRLETHLCISYAAVQWNEAARQLFGFSDTFWKNTRCWHRILHPDDRKLILETENVQLGEITSDGLRYEFEARFGRGDGSYVWLGLKGLLIPTGRFAGIYVNIVEFRQLAETAITV